MAESGGPTTQSGILYQNSIAALYLGRLLDMTQRAKRDSVIEVRVEAPTIIDDIVITYADNHKDWIQAKENLTKGDDAWKTMWYHFEKMRWSDQYSSGDRILLSLGTNTPYLNNLNEMCRRAFGARNVQEWTQSLTSAMNSLLKDIQGLMTTPRQNPESLFLLFSTLDIQCVTMRQIEQIEISKQLPESNVSRQSLFAHLRDLAAKHATVRRLFEVPSLLRVLDEDYQIRIEEPQMYGLNDYLTTQENAYSIIGVPGTALQGHVDSIFVWPSFQTIDSRNMNPIDGIEDPRYFRTSYEDTFSLQDYPNTSFQRVVIVAPAGFGKSTYLKAIAYRATRSEWIPVIISLPDLAESKRTIIDFLQNNVNEHYSVKIQWESYCEKGRVLLLLDGLDELAPSDAVFILQKISAFASRFVKSPYLVTVRDVTALALPLDAKLVKINPLDFEKIELFIDSFNCTGISINRLEFLDQVRSSPDLIALSRIPLFLALMLATYRKAVHLPKKRSELLDQYMSILFNPDEYKTGIKLITDSMSLREIAEYISYVALEKGKIGLTERELQDILKQRGYQVKDITRDLKVCGVITKSLNTLNFVFPIVQEFLASYYVVGNMTKEEFIDKFELTVKRPWAQTLQFALEQHSDADCIMDALLQKEDDVFGSLVQLLGRCIINSCLVSEATRSKVGDRLGELWLEQHIDLCITIGNMIADGFTSSIPARVREILESGRGLSIGGGKIIEAANNPELTIKIFERLLHGSSSNWYKLYSFKDAINRIAIILFPLALDRLVVATQTGEGSKNISPLIYVFEQASLPDNSYLKVVHDIRLAPYLRLAGYELGPKPYIDSSLDLIEILIPSDDLGDYYKVEGLDIAINSIFKTRDPQTVFVHCYKKLNKSYKGFMLNSLVSWDTEKEHKQLVLTQLSFIVQNVEKEHLTIQLYKAYLGDEDAMIEVTEQLNQLDSEQLEMWLKAASHHREAQNVAMGFSTIQKLKLSVEQKKLIIDFLSHIIKFKLVIHGVGGGFQMDPAKEHCAINEVIDLLHSWKSEHVGQQHFVILIQSCLTEIGDKEECALLKQSIGNLLRIKGCRISDEDEEFFAVQNALYSLEKSNELLPIELLAKCVTGLDSNISRMCIGMIAKHMNINALETLQELKKQYGDDNQGYLTSKIHELASRLGVRIQAL